MAVIAGLGETAPGEAESVGHIFRRGTATTVTFDRIGCLRHRYGRERSHQFIT